MAKIDRTKPIASKTTPNTSITIKLPQDVFAFYTEMIRERDPEADPAEEIRDMILRKVSDFLENLEYTPFHAGIEYDREEQRAAFAAWMTPSTKKEWLRSSGRDRWPYCDRLKPRDLRHAKQVGERRRIQELRNESPAEKRARRDAIARAKARQGGAA